MNPHEKRLQIALSIYTQLLALEVDRWPCTGEPSNQCSTRSTPKAFTADDFKIALVLQRRMPMAAISHVTVLRRYFQRLPLSIAKH